MAPCRIALHRSFGRDPVCVLGRTFGCSGSTNEPNGTTMWVMPPCRGIFACNDVYAFCRPLTRPYDDLLGRTNCSCAKTKAIRHELNAHLWTRNHVASQQGWLEQPMRGWTADDAMASARLGGGGGPQDAGTAQLAAQLTAAASTSLATFGRIREHQTSGSDASSSSTARAAAARSMGPSWPSHPLLVPTQVASLTASGALSMPPSTRYVLVEIGCSDRDTLDANGVLEAHADAFLIQLEPLLDKYATLLSRGTARFHGERKADRAVPLGHHHPRAALLPLAVSPAGGLLNLTVTRTAGCSSLAPLNTHATRQWAPWCHRILEYRLVPSITLSAVLALSGSLPIRHLKLDAQGLDFALVASVPPALLRAKVETLELETRAADCEPLYMGQASCPEVVEYLRTVAGYDNLSSCPSKHVRNLGRQWGQPNCERDIRFVRAARGARLPTTTSTTRKIHS
jgi:hypothetical protein